MSGRTPAWMSPAVVVEAMMLAPGDHLRISPAVAGARLIGSLGYAVLGRVGISIAVGRRAWSTTPDSLLLQLDDAGLVERIAVSRPDLAVLADDPWRPLSVVTVLPDLDSLIGWTAERAYPTLVSLVEDVREATGYGRQPMWNLIADTVLGPAATAAAKAGRDARDGHEVAGHLLDALVGLGAPITRRGSLTRRGACCLYYREAGETCSGCPLTRPSNGSISAARA